MSLSRKDACVLLVRVAQAIEDLPYDVHNVNGVPPESFDMLSGNRCVLAWSRYTLGPDGHEILNCEPYSPFEWLYSVDWAYSEYPDARTAKAAAHRIYAWVAYDKWDDVDPNHFDWPKFQASYPFDTCKTAALAVIA